MKRFVFVANGTWGDVGPLAEVAVHLHRRGAHVTFISTPFFEAGLRARGLTVVTAGEHWDPRAALEDPRLAHPVTGARDIWKLVFAPLVRTLGDATLAALQDAPGVVVLHPWCLGGQLAAEQAGVPWAMTALAPITWFSAADAPMISPFDLPPWLARALIRGPARMLFRGYFGQALDADARRRGLPTRPGRFFHATQGAALNLAFWPEHFRRPASDDPPSAALCGFPAPASAAEPLAAEVEQFLASGPPPLVMGLGSALPGLAQELYDGVQEQALALGLRVLLVGATARPGPPEVLRVARAPYPALFPRARVVVHHGGIGSTAEALAAGQPQLVFPFGADQHDNAARLEKLGVGRRLARRAFSGPAVRARLEALLRDEAGLREQAQALAKTQQAQASGVDVAARHLEALAARTA